MHYLHPVSNSEFLRRLEAGEISFGATPLGRKGANLKTLASRMGCESSTCSVYDGSFQGGAFRGQGACVCACARAWVRAPTVCGSREQGAAALWDSLGNERDGSFPSRYLMCVDITARGRTGRSSAIKGKDDPSL